ncbi:diguanylate cyclase [Pollutimonas subterranea]|uniref:diguanylate cyclase n=1 Tax=Pollutimonas subterranea TaxID=2045210 RepID=UPI001304519B|nr:diguanylate cyclase [Pollutimonas subterranea]
MIQWFALLLALGVLGAAIAFNLLQDHRQTGARERDRLSTQARIIALNMEQQLATANRALEALLGDLSVWRDAFDRQTHIEYIRAIATAMPGIRSMGIIDADGILVASNHVGVLGMDFSHRNYFQTAKWQANGETLYISSPYQSIFGSDVINIARAALGPQGEFQGIVFATLNSDYFRTLMGSVLYAPDMWDAVVHSDGSMFLRVPNSDQPARNVAQPGTFFTRHVESGKATTVLTGTPQQGTDNKQIVAQHTIDPAELHMDKALVISTGRTLDTVFLTWTHRVLLQSGLFLIISLVTVLGLYAYQRREREFDRKEAHASAALRASEENHRLIVENTRDVVIKLDSGGAYTYVNPAFEQMFNENLGSMAGKLQGQHVVPEDRQQADAFFESLFHPPYAATVSLRENTADGLRHLHWTAHALLDDHGHVSSLIYIGRDVTQHVTRMTLLEEQAWRDPLTGLANRRHFMDMAEAEIIRAQRYERPLSLLTLDLDHFKSINDTHGHQAGDLVLQEFAAIVTSIVRDVDIVGRTGGEEFAILLPETDIDAALGVSHRLHEAIRSNEVILRSGASLRFTCSMGLAFLDEVTVALNDLFEQADKALYQAKHSGRDRTCVAEQVPAVRGGG